MEVKAAMTERSFNLVVPLAPVATDMRNTDTGGYRAAASGAVTPLNTRPGDVKSTIGTAGPGIRTSTTATRTTATRTTSSAPVPSADGNAHHHADFTFAELAQAYFDCRRTKRNSASALAFEQDLERNLRKLYDELHGDTYQPGRSICFVITRPKPREVWARLCSNKPRDHETISADWNNARSLLAAHPKAEPQCHCTTCRPITMDDMRFVVCPKCGHKRCPHARNHRNDCTGSNEPGFAFCQLE